MDETSQRRAKLIGASLLLAAVLVFVFWRVLGSGESGPDAETQRAVQKADELRKDVEAQPGFVKTMPEQEGGVRPQGRGPMVAPK